MLKSGGYYRGPVDGVLGVGTRTAIRSYQADRGLPVTGEINAALIRSINWQFM